jgi:hypothetical protein
MKGDYILYVTESGKYKTASIVVNSNGFKLDSSIKDNYFVIAVFVNFIRVNAVIETVTTNEIQDNEYIQASVINNLYFSMSDIMDKSVYNPAYTDFNIVPVVSGVPYVSTKQKLFTIFTKQFNTIFK